MSTIEEKLEAIRNDAALKGWLPIETAPRDGRMILIAKLFGMCGPKGVFWRFEVVPALWRDSVWYSYGWSSKTTIYGSGELHQPAFWQPFPIEPVCFTTETDEEDSAIYKAWKY